jgi:hypothetical protein
LLKNETEKTEKFRNETKKIEKRNETKFLNLDSERIGKTVYHKTADRLIELTTNSQHRLNHRILITKVEAYLACLC